LSAIKNIDIGQKNPYQSTSSQD